MKKIYVFDLDNTLCPLGKPLAAQTVEGLRALEERGGLVAVCSGKPTYYLCGLMRQVGLKEPLLIGENGGVIQFGVDLPPEKFYIVTEKKRTLTFFKEKRRMLEEKYGNALWFQPNEAMLTPFPRDPSIFDELEGDLQQARDYDCRIYRFCDCFDVVPDDVDKGRGLSYLAGLLGVLPKDFVAVGDGENDYPMFEFAGLSIGIGLKDPQRADLVCSSIGEALEYLLKEEGDA
ncbi:MAG: HAD family phosphatase [Clostridia bacterium]|nr:HAD family phosphatase [Clostridia bacterium]